MTALIDVAPEKLLEVYSRLLENRRFSVDWKVEKGSLLENVRSLNVRDVMSVDFRNCNSQAANQELVVPNLSLKYSLDNECSFIICQMSLSYAL